MKPVVRRTLHWAGACLAIAGVCFVTLRLQSYWNVIDIPGINLGTATILICLIVLYGFANLLLVDAWRSVLAHCGVPTTLRWAIRTYGITQLAKYVPGNIFHLAGRQAMGVAAGAPSGALATSMVWEFGLIGAAGALYLWFAAPLVLRGFPEASSFLMLGCSILFVAGLLNKFFGLLITKCFILQSGFLVLSGITFAILTKDISSPYSARTPWEIFSISSGAYVLAWLAGLLTPGAPAGVGIREAILLILLKDIVPETDLLVAVMTGRLVTVLGDLLTFVIAIFIPLELYNPEHST